MSITIYIYECDILAVKGETLVSNLAVHTATKCVKRESRLPAFY